MDCRRGGGGCEGGGRGLGVSVMLCLFIHSLINDDDDVGNIA